MTERSAEKEGAVTDGGSGNMCTPEEVRKLADTVQMGECITFPNGLVIDKRPLPISLPSVWWAQYQPPVQPGYPHQPYQFPPGQTWCEGS